MMMEKTVEKGKSANTDPTPRLFTVLPSATVQAGAPCLCSFRLLTEASRHRWQRDM